MKRLILVILFIFLLGGIAQAADTAVSGLTEDSSPADDSLVYTVDDPGGTPASRKTTLANMWTWIYAHITSTIGAAYDTSAELDALFAAEQDVLAEGAFVNGDKTKLDGIETAADVTDATNVAAAGAIMDSDFSNNGFMRRTGAGTYQSCLDTFDASSAPTANEDSGDGYCVGSLYVDTTADKAYVCLDNTSTAAVWTETTQSGSATALDDIANPDANNSISMAGYTDTRVSTTDGWGGLIIHTNVANNASPTTLLTLQSDDANDSTNTVYLSIKEDMDGTPATLFEFKGRTLALGTNSSITGIADLTVSISLGTAAAEVPDIYIGDGAVIYGGDDQDTTWTHIPDTGWLINSSRQLQFGDSGTYVAQSTDGTLALIADTILHGQAPNIRLAFDAAAYLNVATTDGGGTVISQTSDGVDTIDIGDTGDQVRIVGVTAGANDGYYDGIVRTYTVDSGQTETSFGQAYHVDTDGELIVADGDVASQGSMPAIGLAVETGTGAKKVLLRGLICETDWAWTVGGPVYVSDDPSTTEGLTQTAISTTGDTVQLVGIAVTADCIEVSMGGYNWIEVP